MTDDLQAPLGQTRPVERGFPVVKASAYLMIGLLALSLLGFAGWALAVDDPFGGEPIAIAGVDVRVQSAVRKADEPPIKVQGTAPTDVAISDTALPSAPPGTRIVTIIDGMSGRRQNVVVPEFVEQNAAPEDRSTDRWSPDRSRQNPLLKAATDGPRAAKSTSAKQVIP